MRIIAGEYRGRAIKAPKGDGTRPTTDRVRESLMSALASARGGLEGAVVLDAFAGSGALGLEALSRGAASACFFERDGAAASVVSGNLRTLGLEPRRARLVRADVLEKPPFRQRPAFDLVFLDPPYALAAEESLRMVTNLAKTGAVSGDAIVVYEHALSTNVDADEAEAACGFALSSRKKYGETSVDILRLADTLG